MTRNNLSIILISLVVGLSEPGVQGGALGPSPDFSRSVNPIQARRGGANYAPGFLYLSTALGSMAGLAG